MQADRIRQFILEKYLRRARCRRQSEVIIRAGDVHRELGLVSAMPAVCSALGGSKLRELANVRLTERRGPANGANVYFRFDLLDGEPLIPAAATRSTAREPSRAPDLPFVFDAESDLVLVACVKSKQGHAAPARQLYTSPWFTLVRALVERGGARWFILSAKHGLTGPNEVIEPYEQTLKTASNRQRREWASVVLNRLFPQLGAARRVVIFAGQSYRQFLLGPLMERGLKIEVPMEGLSLGNQLAWLSGRR